MLTTKQRSHPIIARTWTAPKPKSIVQAIAITALAALLLPSATSLIGHQIRLQAAGGQSCFRVNADRTDQIRKYGAECDL